MSDSFGINVWGVVAGALGTGALVPVLYSWFKSRLPSSKLPYLLELLQSTQDLFNEGIRDGLLPNENDIYQCRLSLYSLKILIGEVSAEVDSARPWKKDVRNWYCGLSGKISDLSHQLSITRARLSRIQSGERKRLAALGYAIKPTPFPQPAPQDYLTAYVPPSLPPPLPQIAPDMQHLPTLNTPCAASPVHVFPEPPITAPSAVAPCVQALADPAAVAAPSLSDGSPCQSSDSTLHDDVIPGRPTVTPTHHNISDEDVQPLLSIRLITPQPRSGGRRQRTSRRTVLLQFSRKLFSPDTSSDGRVEIVFPRGKPVGPRSRQTAGAMRHSGGPYSHGRTGTYSLEDVDLEAQVHTLGCAPDSDSDSGEWSDV